jgi:transposase-like protein
MAKQKYSAELKEQVLKDLDEVGDIDAVCNKHNVPKHAVYRFRRARLESPSINKDRMIKALNRDLKEKDLENRILRELLKKTYQVMPIELDSRKNS